MASDYWIGAQLIPVPPFLGLGQSNAQGARALLSANGLFVCGDCIISPGVPVVAAAMRYLLFLLGGPLAAAAICFAMLMRVGADALLAGAAGELVGLAGPEGRCLGRRER